MPRYYNIPALLLVISSSLLAHLGSPQVPTKPTHVDETCDDFIDDYDYDSQHSSNVRALVEELTNQALKAFFYNSSVGSGKDKVYGQYYCRTDLDLDFCGQCITEATNNVCIGGLHAVVWYEECTFFYDWRSITGVYDGTYMTIDRSSVGMNDSESFFGVLNSTLEMITKEAVSSHGLATGEGMVSDSETVYCLVQCSPDLNATECNSCLDTMYMSSVYMMAVLNALYKSNWARWVSIYDRSCHLRYSTNGSFYRLNTAAVPTGSPQSPEEPHLPTTKDSPPRRGKNASYYVVRAVIAIAAVIGSLTIVGISFCLIRRRNKVKKPTQGMLNDGKSIAVKRLSKGSTQGTAEFKTEVAVLAKLQHKNLVQLIGCCVDGEERLLVYEFLSNLSLDRFLFDPIKSSYLTWGIRHKIIQGIARGLHYLHEDLRVKIVHRDLKTSNILLDDNLDPKIADFGLARLVKVDQTAGNTTKVVGTYGYISPEYALSGRYSTKSDVYSLGVIVLEILSGKSNNLFYDISHSEGLLQHAWRVWNGGAIEQLIDPIIQNNHSRIEAERCLQIGLLCVQDDATSRPTMRAMLTMLDSNIVDLPPPLSPTHYNYINKLSSDDGSQESIRKQQEDGSGLSSTTFSGLNDQHPR